MTGDHITIVDAMIIALQQAYDPHGYIMLVYAGIVAILGLLVVIYVR